VKQSSRSTKRVLPRAEHKPNFSLVSILGLCIPFAYPPSAESKRSKSATTASPARPARAKRKTSKSRNAGVPKVPRSNKKSSPEKPASPPTQSKPKRCVPQLPDIMEEDEDDLLDDRPPTPGLNSLPGDSRNVSAPLTGKKRAIESVDPSAESPEPTQKRAKRTRTKVEGKPKGKVATREKAAKTKGNDAPSTPKVSKGRPRRTPEREASVHDAHVTTVKRKKASEDQLSNNRPVRGVKRRKLETETETEDESPRPKKAKQDTTGQGLADSRRMPTKTTYVSTFGFWEYFNLTHGQETEGEHDHQAYRF